MEENTINVEEQVFNTKGVFHIQLPVFSIKANSGYVMTGLNNLNMFDLAVVRFPVRKTVG